MKFITSNKNKFLEVKQILGEHIEQLNIDVEEIQSLDIEKVIKQKVEEIKKHYNKPFFCEDVSVELKALEGFPGPLIKFLVKSIGSKGIHKILQGYEEKAAKAICVVGYFDGEKTHIFKGEIKGKIVEPKGESGFGFDPVFIPQGFNKTFAEMSDKEKNKISHRKKAFLKLNEYLN
ncbi:MAG: RdgB/HAM1 family non-canonical purine NTP pyrophosphatase [Candidatus Woesearchaeota archaeon]